LITQWSHKRYCSTVSSKLCLFSINIFYNSLPGILQIRRFTSVQIIFAINESSKLTPSETVFRDELNQKPCGFETLKNVHCLIKYNEAMYIHGYVHVGAFFSSKINILGATPTTSSVYRVYLLRVFCQAFFLPKSLQPITVSAILRGRVRQFDFKNFTLRRKRKSFSQVFCFWKRKKYFSLFLLPIFCFQWKWTKMPYLFALFRLSKFHYCFLFSLFASKQKN
jgi:hypothetical protein